MTITRGGPAEERFAELFHDFYGDVFRYAARRVGSDDAQDVAAEVFTIAWQHLSRVPEVPLPWLYRTAWHAVRNRQRAGDSMRRLRDRLRNEAATDTFGRDPAESASASEAVLTALRQLSDLDQEAVRLVCWEDLSLSDAASVLGCSDVALKVRLHRVRRRLTVQLAPSGAATCNSSTPMEVTR